MCTYVSPFLLFLCKRHCLLFQCFPASTPTECLCNRKYMLFFGNKIFNSLQLLTIYFSQSQNTNILLLFFFTSHHPNSPLLCWEDMLKIGENRSKYHCYNSSVLCWSAWCSCVAWICLLETGCGTHSTESYRLKAKATILLTLPGNLPVSFIFE